MTLSADEFLRCQAVVTKWRRPLLLTHTRPDGDALGGLVAMRSILRGTGSDPLAVVFEPVPARYQLLVEHEPLDLWKGTMRGSADEGEATTSAEAALLAGIDGILVLDTCTYNQLEPASEWLRRDISVPPPVLAVDHHVTRDEMADHYLIDEEASATCTIVYEWATACGWEMDATAVSALFVGMATDTGWFRFSNTDVRTLEIAAAMLRQGVMPNDVYLRLYQSESVQRMRLFGAALAAMELHIDNRLAVIPITSEMFTRAGATQADTEDIINEPLRIGSVEVSVLLADAGDGVVKTSFRSKRDIDVAALASRFGGGGHVKAAGDRLSGSIDAVKNKVTAALRALLS